MKILLIDNGSSLLEKLEALIPGNEIVKKFDDLENINLKDFDLIVLSGGGKHNVVSDRNIFSEEIRLIKSEKPVIGICLGCELIATEFGGGIEKMSEKFSGMYEIEMLDSGFGFEKINVYEGHSWIINKMPSNFDLLARSERGPEIIKHQTLPIYGIQFHPENCVDVSQGDELFLKILKNI